MDIAVVYQAPRLRETPAKPARPPFAAEHCPARVEYAK
jgi:hypothetical protein